MRILLNSEEVYICNNFRLATFQASQSLKVFLMSAISDYILMLMIDNFWCFF